MKKTLQKPSRTEFRNKLHEVIFEAETSAGKLFDVVLIGSIFASLAVVMLDSIAALHDVYGTWFYAAEWAFTLLFTLEYLLRLYCIERPVGYAVSFFGIVDLLAVLPTYFSLLIPGAQYLLAIRAIRVLRIFRVLKLVQYLREARMLIQAMRASRRKITVFVFTVLMLVIVFGSIMYIIEGEASGFTSIPRSIYWAIVTMTTVGYGDISPKTPAGQAVAAMIMIIGYAIIAVPTGIVTAEVARTMGRSISTQACRHCSAEGHDSDALYCKYCGAKL